MGACGWEVLGCDNCAAFSTLDDAQREEVQDWAVNRLWEWTGSRFGPCAHTVLSPEDGSCCCWAGHSLDSCSCRYSGLRLPGPIAEPLEVWRAGEEVLLEDLRVVDNNTLELINGERWTRDWEVTYLLGEPVPAGGGMIAGLLAQEYAKAVCNDDTCRLPRRVSSVQRQGVVIGMLDNFTNLEDGFTGIWVIDDWIMTQIKPKKRSAVSSPDVLVPRIVTWTYDGS